MNALLISTKHCKLNIGMVSGRSTEEEIERPATGHAPRSAEPVHESGNTRSHLIWVRQPHGLLTVPDGGGVRPPTTGALAPTPTASSISRSHRWSPHSHTKVRT